MKIQNYYLERFFFYPIREAESQCLSTYLLSNVQQLSVLTADKSIMDTNLYIGMIYFSCIRKRNHHYNSEIHVQSQHS